jgi:hypothetical protein
MSDGRCQTATSLTWPPRPRLRSLSRQSAEPVRTTHADGFSLLPVAVLGRGIGTRLGDIGSEKLKALFCASVTSERAGGQLRRPACSPVWRPPSSFAEDPRALREAVAREWLVEARFSFDHDCSTIGVRA